MEVHSKESVFVLRDGKGKIQAQGTLPTTEKGWCEGQTRYEGRNGTAVARESGALAFFVARSLRALGLEPIVGDAHEGRLRAHRPRQKRDRRDAHERCEGLRRGV
jgi:hypothetical protein